LPLQTMAKCLEQDIGADGVGFHSLGPGCLAKAVRRN